MRLKFDTSEAQKNFARGIDAMGKLTGLDRKKIILAEAGSILKTCASRTKVASQPQIDLGARLRALKSLDLTRGGDITVNAGIKGPFGRVFIKKKSGGGYRRTHEAGFVPINQHYTNAIWSKLQATVSDAKKVVAKVAQQAKASAALARGSWVRIGDSLGIRLEDVPGGGGISSSSIEKARQARARAGLEKNNGTSKIESSAGKFFVTLINRLPYGRKIGLDTLLAVTVSNRAKYMYQSIAKGFRGSAQDVAKRFPGWVVKSGPN